MPFSGPPLEVLQAIVKTTGPTYQEVRGGAMLATLEADGSDLDLEAVARVLLKLIDQGAVTCTGKPWGGDPRPMRNIEVVGDALAEVDPNWPSQGIAQADVQALLEAIGELANAPGLSEDQREAASTITAAGKEVGYGVISEVLVTWARSLGLLP